MASYIPRSDAELVAWMATFVGGCNSYSLELGLTTAQLQSLDYARGLYNNRYETAQQARLDYEASIGAKDEARQSSVAIMREIAQSIRNNPDVPNSLLKQLGLNPRNTARPPVTPNTPQNLVSYPDPNAASARLQWHPGGNDVPTTYLVQSRSGQGDWETQNVTTKRRATVAGINAGKMTEFRVIAVRAGLESDPSNVAVVYAAA